MTTWVGRWRALGRDVRVVGLMVLALALAGVSTIARGQEVAGGSAGLMSPEAKLGYRPGADGKLVEWSTVAEYVREVGERSRRVEVVELGRTTEDRPYLVAIVSNEATIANLDRAKEHQAKLHDPRKLADQDEAVRIVKESKPVVLITCTIHSSETASTFTAMELLHELATGDDPATREILDNTILLLVPSANPDGVDITARWYEKTKGKPWEGDGMPVLYHKYAGHDTNRDWFMLNLQETRLLTRMLYFEWLPTITYDIHQMGSTGARIFVPPFYEPQNPNIHPRVTQGIFLIGAHMAWSLASERKQGVLTNAMYDNWWNGGCRTVPQRHNMVGILTESASVKLATPIFLEKSQLKGATRGFPNHDLAVNFADPWPGGWWRLRDIVDYQLICARATLSLAARYRECFQGNLLEMSRDAIATGENEPPYGWVVTPDPADPARAARMVRILHDTGIDVLQAEDEFTLGGQTYSKGTYVLPASQPFRPHLKDMMERQVYPNRLRSDGTAEPPYDVAGWTLPLLMGVASAPLSEPLDPSWPLTKLTKFEAPQGRVEGLETAKVVLIPAREVEAVAALAALNQAGVEVRRRVVASADRPEASVGSWVVRAVSSAREVLEPLARERGLRVVGVAGDQADSLFERDTQPLRLGRIGLYKPWKPSMDEGWTRLVLETHGVSYTTLHDADIKGGNLNERFDVIVLPSVSAATIRDGWGLNETDPAYVGGLGREGQTHLRRFVNEGGRLVCLENSCEFAIAAFKPPIVEVLRSLKSSEFYGPGSIFRAQVPAKARESPFAFLLDAMPDDPTVYFSRSLAFALRPEGGDLRGNAAESLLDYASRDVLESGWLLGEEKIAGRSALMALRHGKGEVILFGFPPQFRGQTVGTFRLFFNALMLTRDQNQDRQTAKPPVSRS